MNTLLEIGLSNAIMAGLLALPAAAVSTWGRRPALAHVLWLLVLIKLITPPLFSVSIPWPASSEAVSSQAAFPASASSAAPALEAVKEQDWRTAAPEEAGLEGTGASTEYVIIPVPSSEPSPRENAALAATATPAPARGAWKPWVLGLWLAGSSLCAVLAVVHVVRFRRLIRRAKPAPSGLSGEAQRLAAQLGLARCPRIWLLPGRITPMLWALLGRPHLLLPAELFQSLDAPQRRTLLAHELAHLRRRDHWVRTLELVVLMLYWWHPVVWWARRELREAEEQCCDAWVVSTLPSAARTYALALVQTLDFLADARPPLPMGASGLGPVYHVRRRLTMIMQGGTSRSLTWRGCLAVLGVGAMLLPVAPVWAQRAPERAEEKSDRDKQIEALKKALEILEREKAGEKAKPQAEQLEKARAAVKSAEAQLARARGQLEQAEAQLDAARANLRKLQGTGGDPERDKIRFRLIDPRGEDKSPEAGFFKHKGIPFETKVVDIDVKDVIFRKETATPGERVFIKKVPTDDKPEDLEKRLDRLMKELEELRREMKRPAPAAPDAKPTEIRYFKEKRDGASPEIDFDVVIPAFPYPLRDLRGSVRIDGPAEGIRVPAPAPVK